MCGMEGGAVWYHNTGFLRLAMGEQMKDDALIHVTQTGGVVLPALITHAGEKAAWRFLEFFTVNIRNKNTRAAYRQAAGVVRTLWAR